MRKAFELYATVEYTLKAVAIILDQAGLRSYKGNVLSVSCVQRLLQNPIYYDVFSFNGEIYDGTHEPIISKKLFDDVQQVMNNRGKKKRKRKHEFAFSGLMKCGKCGCFITTETQKGHNYLRCTKRKNPCSQRYAREDAITSQIREEIKKVSLSSAWANASINYFENEKMKIAQAENSFAQKASDELVEIETKLERLLDLQLDDNLSQAEYATKKHKLILAKKDLEENIGSNFILKDKIFQFALKIGWRVIERGDEPTKTFPNWRCAFEKIRTDFAQNL